MKFLVIDQVIGFLVMQGNNTFLESGFLVTFFQKLDLTNVRKCNESKVKKPHLKLSASADTYY